MTFHPQIPNRKRGKPFFFFFKGKVLTFQTINDSKSATVGWTISWFGNTPHVSAVGPLVTFKEFFLRKKKKKKKTCQILYHFTWKEREVLELITSFLFLFLPLLLKELNKTHKQKKEGCNTLCFWLVYVFPWKSTAVYVKFENIPEFITSIILRKLSGEQKNSRYSFW